MSAPLTIEQLFAHQAKLDQPPPKGHKRYRVTVYEWSAWEIFLDAESNAVAEEVAEQFWSDIGGDAFHLKDGGFDNLTVEECVPDEPVRDGGDHDA